MILRLVSYPSSGGRAIGEVLHTVWNRLSHRQFLFLYPFVIGIFEALAFLAIFAAFEPRLSWDRYAREQFDLAGYIKAMVADTDQLLVPTIAIVGAGAAFCLVNAAVRPAYFRAAAGAPYGVAPRSWREVGRLFVFYALTFPILDLAWVFLPDSSVTLVAVIAILILQMLIIFTEYAIVLEGLAVVPALRRSIRLVERAWPAVVAGTIAYYLVASGIAMIYADFYENADRIFVGLPLSQILVFSLVTVVVDVYFIALYGHLARSG